MDIKKKVGNRIRELRNERGLTQEKLGHIADIDRTYINSVENGRRNISIENLEKLSFALKMNLRMFFDSNIFE